MNINLIPVRSFIRSILLVGCLCIQTEVFSQDLPPTKSYSTRRVEGDEPIIDGSLDDTVWEQVEWGGSFVQRQPSYGDAPSEQTRFKILYDDKFLYVGVHCLDSEPEKIVRRMSRRDGFDGDFVEINIDSYDDDRTAFSFTASVSGVKGDEYISNNGDNWDATWDPIWYLSTSIVEDGWIAEFKIPLSQLRFADKPAHTWGIQFTRLFFRNNERSTWQPIAQDAPGWVHLFGGLRGIEGIRPQKQLEIQPYVVAQAEKFPAEDGDPYRTGTDQMLNAGLDAKIGITSDITLDLTINPDFGQVEADPSAVNLSAFRLFFREQRPFFLEGNNLFDFRLSGGPNNLFYSRRIGAPARGEVLDDDIAFIDRTPPTRILGAVKITGKNSRGFSWGYQDAVTGQVKVNVTDTLGNERSEKIEPLTHYSTLRFQKEFNQAQTIFGGFASNVRRIGNDENELNLLHDNAQSVGVDFQQNFANRTYGLELRLAASRVAGSPEAIEQTQTASERFFQRPDNNYRELDTTRSVLTGTTSRFSFGKIAGNLRFRVGVNHRSPGLSLNDVGFLNQADDINVWSWTQYRVLQPKGLFRNQFYNFQIERNYDFGGRVTRQSFGLNFDSELDNLWGLASGLWVDTWSVSNADLRGGPAIRYPGGVNWWGFVGTNQQKTVRFFINPSFYWGQNDFVLNQRLRFGITARPVDALRISVEPIIFRRRFDLQYVDTAERIDGSEAYVLARLKQSQYSLSLRANYNITPNLTVEFWGQPFLVNVAYDQYKSVSDEAQATLLENRYNSIPADRVLANVDGDLEIFETGASEPDFTISQPDFNVVQLRTNLVLRWEYVPGSTFFAVWSHNSDAGPDPNDVRSFDGLANELVGLRGTNTFVIKYTYRFIL